MDTTLYDQLNAIQKKVVHNFTYETDQDQYGVAEKWVMPPDRYNGLKAIVGDCEDFALACRKLCRDAGLKTRLVVCEIGGEGHCVLECEGWIFDCNESAIISNTDLEQKGYHWIYISGYEPGDLWRLIKKDD